MTPDLPSPEQVFHEARAIESPSEREGYLKGACGNDAALRSKVDALLAADAEAGSFLASADRTAGTTVAAAPHEQAGTMIGRYKLLQPIGEDGFGIQSAGVRAAQPLSKSSPNRPKARMRRSMTRNNPIPFAPDPVIEAYKRDVDRTLLRENLKLPVEDRFRKLKELQRLAQELQRAGRKARSQA
ncbi:MAG: hypothetical protein IH888_08545 [Planctomycetes bacterium]|nr:hypothetical protein [Planctomycetota bacterium]